MLSGHNVNCWVVPSKSEQTMCVKMLDYFIVFKAHGGHAVHASEGITAFENILNPEISVLFATNCVKNSIWSQFLKQPALVVAFLEDARKHHSSCVSTYNLLLSCLCSGRARRRKHDLTVTCFACWRRTKSSQHCGYLSQLFSNCTWSANMTKSIMAVATSHSPFWGPIGYGPPHNVFQATVNSLWGGPSAVSDGFWRR